MSSNSRKRRNPFAEEQVKQAKVVKYDTETIQRKYSFEGTRSDHLLNEF